VYIKTCGITYATDITEVSIGILDKRLMWAGLPTSFASEECCWAGEPRDELLFLSLSDGSYRCHQEGSSWRLVLWIQKHNRVSLVGVFMCCFSVCLGLLARFRGHLLVLFLLCVLRCFVCIFARVVRFCVVRGFLCGFVDFRSYILKK
jgi:hypothetical protein